MSLQSKGGAQGAWRTQAQEGAPPFAAISGRWRSAGCDACEDVLHDRFGLGVRSEEGVDLIALASHDDAARVGELFKALDAVMAAQSLLLAPAPLSSMTTRERAGFG